MRTSKLPVFIGVAILVIVCVGLAFARLSVAPPSWTFVNSPISAEQLKGQGDVNFLAFDDVSLEEWRELGRYYKSKYGLDIHVLSGFKSPETAWNPTRIQFAAEDVVQVIASTFPQESVGRAHIYILP